MPTGTSVAVGPKATLSEETSKPVGAVTVTLPRRFAPLTVKLCEDDGVPASVVKGVGVPAVLRVGANGSTTVKFVALVATGSPATSTEIGPVVAPEGTVAVISVPAGLTELEAAMPLKRTAGVAPKLLPLIVTDAPTWPEDGVNETMTGEVAEEAGVTEAHVVPRRMLPTRSVAALPAVPCRR